MSARHLKRLDTLSLLYAFNFPHIANKQRPKEEPHTERTEKGGAKTRSYSYRGGESSATENQSMRFKRSIRR
jgi:hypothetical protein